MSGLGGPPSPTGVAWPEPRRGEQWDIYLDGAFKLTQCVSDASAEIYVRGGYQNSQGHWQAIPHGWDYMTKQPKDVANPSNPPAAASGLVCRCGKAMASNADGLYSTCSAGKCSEWPAWRCGARCGYGLCAEHAERATSTEAKSKPTEAAPAEGNKESVAKAHREVSATPIVRDSWHDAMVADLMQREGRYDNGSLLIATETRRSSPFEKLYGRVEPSKRYPPSDDPEQDVRNEWEW